MLWQFFGPVFRLFIHRLVTLGISVFVRIEFFSAVRSPFDITILISNCVPCHFGCPFQGSESYKVSGRVCEYSEKTINGLEPSIILLREIPSSITSILTAGFVVPIEDLDLCRVNFEVTTVKPFPDLAFPR